MSDTIPRDREAFSVITPVTLRFSDQDPLRHINNVAITALLESGRTAPHMSGLGLLEAIPNEVLQSWADPDDADGDGISGRPNMVWDATAEQMAVGRFGWKAGNLQARGSGSMRASVVQDCLIMLLLLRIVAYRYPVPGI